MEIYVTLLISPYLSNHLTGKYSQMSLKFDSSWLNRVTDCIDLRELLITGARVNLPVAPYVFTNYTPNTEFCFIFYKLLSN